ncbi:MAG: hypothetical protein SFU86_13945 [Pirellulaceae bacterium]|nr:hypothetical protein [Pirellulaceae bacterium]
MITPRWTYSNSSRLSKWYGHVEYYGPYVIGQWFALNAETGAEYWSRRFFRPTTVCDCAHDVIVASETRSDGPWVFDFGIYGIHAQTGKLLWTNHGRGLWGRMLRCFDYVPGFTNEFRDAPERVVGRYVVTSAGRFLDIGTGHQCPSPVLEKPHCGDRLALNRELYDNKSLAMDGDTILVQGHHDDFVILRRDKSGREFWRFAAKERGLHVDGNFYSYRLHNGRIFIILGDAPKYVRIKASSPYVKRSPANYYMGILNVSTGKCDLFPLAEAKLRTECRIESIRDDRVLISCDDTQLVEYSVRT